MYSKQLINKYLIFLADLLCVEDIPELVCDDVPYPRYSFLTNQIIISEINYNDRLLVLYLAHEMYHVYQFLNMYDGIKESLYHYHSPDKDNKKYYGQEFELEAFAFQTFIMQLIGIKIDYSKSHPNLPDISGRVKAMYCDFTKEEVLDSLEYSELNIEDLLNEFLKFD